MGFICKTFQILAIKFNLFGIIINLIKKKLSGFFRLFSYKNKYLFSFFKNEGFFMMTNNSENFVFFTFLGYFELVTLFEIIFLGYEKFFTGCEYEYTIFKKNPNEIIKRSSWKHCQIDFLLQVNLSCPNFILVSKKVIKYS